MGSPFRARTILPSAEPGGPSIRSSIWLVDRSKQRTAERPQSDLGAAENPSNATSVAQTRLREESILMASMGQWLGDAAKSADEPDSVTRMIFFSRTLVTRNVLVRAS